MSHVSVGSFTVRDNEADLRAVEIACSSLGLEFVRNAKTFHWFGKWVNDYKAADAGFNRGLATEDYGKCEHVIRLRRTDIEQAEYEKNPEKKPYEIGLVKLADGSLGFAFDHWNHGVGVQEILQKVGGKELVKLGQTVASTKVAMAVAKQRGHYIKRVEELPDGRQKIVIGTPRREEF